jgi:TonB family protein
MRTALRYIRQARQPAGRFLAGILFWTFGAGAQPPAPTHQPILDRVVQTYAGIQGYRFDAVVTNHVTARGSRAKTLGPAALGPEEQTVSVAYSAPNQLRLEGTVDTTVHVFRDAGESFVMKTGSNGYASDNDGTLRHRTLSQLGLTDYTAIGEDLLGHPRVLHSEDLTVDGASIPCSVIEATYRARPNGDWHNTNRRSSWIEKRKFWVDTARFAVLREVDLVHGVGAADGVDSERTIAVRTLVWNERPPDSLFDVPALSGTILPDGSVAPGRNGFTPAVPIVEGCGDMLDPGAQLDCFRQAQMQSCSNLPTTPEVRAARLGDSALLEYTIDTEGRPAGIRMLQPLGLGLDEEAAECVSHWRFRPATRNGVAVALKSTMSLHLGAETSSLWHLRSVVFHPADGVSRPVFLKTEYPQIPEGEQVTGCALFHVRLNVDESGTPRDVQAKPTEKPAFDKQAVRIVSKWRFEPGRHNDAAAGVPAEFILALGDGPTCERSATPFHRTAPR